MNLAPVEEGGQDLLAVTQNKLKHDLRTNDYNHAKGVSTYTEADIY